jgi:hypothetical protein
MPSSGLPWVRTDVAKRRYYPWSVLGIDKTEDARAIKIAYAAKLKVTRPEEDAEAFQALVAARDAAILFAATPEHTPARAKKPGRVARPADIGQHEEIAPALELSPKPASPRPRRKKRTTAESLPIAANGTDHLITLVKQLLSSKEQQFPFDELENALKSLKHYSISERLAIEEELLPAVMDYLEISEAHPIRGIATSYDDGMLSSQQKYAVLLLDDEYGWTENDRRLADIVWFDGKEFADRLQRLKNPRMRYETAEPKTVVGWRRYVGYFVFLMFALNILGKCSTSHDRDYDAIRRAMEIERNKSQTQQTESP